MTVRHKGWRLSGWGVMLLLCIAWMPEDGFGQVGPDTRRPPAKAGSPGPAQAAGKAASAKEDFTIVLHPAAEPNERAFTFLLPRGWIVKGGIYRVNPMQAGGSANSIEAKCDIAMQSDAGATIMVRRLPKINYADGPMATRLFPYGSNYNGAQVVAMPTVDGYLQWLFKSLHPGASDVRVVAKQNRADLAQAIQKYCEPFNAQLRGMGLAPMVFHAGGMAVEYAEAGVRFKEGLFTVLMDWRQAAALWCNDHTIVMRAPAPEADTWKPVLDTILNSVEAQPPVGRGRDERPGRPEQDRLGYLEGHPAHRPGDRGAPPEDERGDRQRPLPHSDRPGGVHETPTRGRSSGTRASSSTAGRRRAGITSTRTTRATTRTRIPTSSAATSSSRPSGSASAIES